MRIPWRMVVAAGMVAAVGYGAYTLIGQAGASGAGQAGPRMFGIGRVHFLSLRCSS